MLARGMLSIIINGELGCSIEAVREHVNIAYDIQPARPCVPRDSQHSSDCVPRVQRTKIPDLSGIELMLLPDPTAIACRTYIGAEALP